MNFTRNTKYEIEIEAKSAKAMANYKKALEQSGKFEVSIVVNNKKFAVAKVTDEQTLQELPEIGSKWVA